MKWLYAQPLWAILLAAIVLGGCSSQHSGWAFRQANKPAPMVSLEIEDPALPVAHPDCAGGALPPHTLRDPGQVTYRDLSLQEALQIAMTNSRVLQDLGGTVLRTPEAVHTTLDPAIQETDPLYGPEAALSAFDAQFSAGLAFQRNNQVFNNTFMGDRGMILQDADVAQSQITKRTATGTVFTLRQAVDFNVTNDPGNRSQTIIDGRQTGSWDALVEGEVRHPLLRGGGLEFNRIAGPGARPGVYNGVLIARIRTDISLADFEVGVRDFITNVENAYWDLYYAYRNLDIRVRMRDKSRDIWQKVDTRCKEGHFSADIEAQAREQLFRFEEDVQNALAGKLADGTQTNNGSAGGSFRGGGGVQSVERRLRMLIGLPTNETCLLRPNDEPSTAPVAFDWCAITTEAVWRRPELRRQRYGIKARELELLASRNFLLPNLDLLGMYRRRGFGTQMIGPSTQEWDSAFGDLYHGKTAEWQAGIELSMPLGFRDEHVGVRNAEQRLARAHALLQEEERRVIHDLSNAVAEKDRAQMVLQTNVNRWVAAQEQFNILNDQFEHGQKIDFFVLLDAQRRSAEAEDRYFQSRVEYTLALRNVGYEKGSLLEDCSVSLTEGPWPDKAYRDAADRARYRTPPLNLHLKNPPPAVAQ